MKSALRLLLTKYDVPGPRYTSYPTVPAWHSSVGAADYRRALSSIDDSGSLSLYIHIPFCERLCHFCGCMQVITADRQRSLPYVEKLMAEIELVAAQLSPQARNVSQLHFGGGTPNFLQPEELTRIVETLHRHFRFLPRAEIAIEMHPRTSTRAFCENLQKLGFNRISLGVQDFDPQVQALIHRHQTYEMTEAMVSLLRTLDFRCFNFDLIYGLPGQSLPGWENTLQQVLALRPNRLAVYSYAHVPWVRPVQRSFKDEDLPSPELKLELFQRAYEVFLTHGYRTIGMDHFALADDELSLALDEGSLHRNFMGYSTHADAHQLGFGVSAISYAGGHYFQNLKQLPSYESSLAKRELATFRGFLLERDDAIRRELIMAVMCRGEIDIVRFEKHWGVSFRDYFAEEHIALQPLIQDALLRLEPTKLTVTSAGFLFLRNISMVFDRYLAGIRQGANNPTFSRTV